ncbi:hypothetical protein DUNSADRAFT_17579 [Dunaliella salina]|uniref:MARVEL domain-containing protein n=1 Tax=Dunaliella salina TaxID=3046 RepID=A0ABZ3KH23_DUNSA|nr:hypothetical protein DUNSADRAFT_17579 [Dunaliella salina]|eukprot:KAF5828471.1 hypothetical protein DUNSADRAFT_17579 [Dunaliella salina]
MLHNTGMKIGMAVVLFFVFAGWVVALGGTAHATNECREESDAWLLPNNNPATDAQGPNPNINNHLQPFPTPNNDEDQTYNCGIHFSLDWWIIAFQFYMIIVAYLGVFVEFFHTKQTIGDFYAIATVLFTIYTSIYVKLGYEFSAGEHDDNAVAQGYKTAASGGIIVCVCNYVFMYLWGSEEGASEGGASAENKA